MRVLLLLRGSPGCGKSTWIHDNGLDNYTLSSDHIRMMYCSPELSLSGGEQISQIHDKRVWDTLFSILEYRMQNGDFTVIDSTNSRTREMKRYLDLCEKYKYRVYCVDFTNIPIDVAKAQNKNREEFKIVPDCVIDKVYSRFETQNIPSGITVITPDELDKVWMQKIDLSSYSAVNHIGDIHGCYSALKKYLEDSDGMKDDEMYIFCGDYIDRGVENAEVIKFLLSIYEKPNVILLEGNHEKWLNCWAHGETPGSKEFANKTSKQLDSAHIGRRDVARLYRRLAQCAYYEYDGNTYLVTHAGLSTLPENLTKVSTVQMIKGVGSYNDAEDVDNAFEKNTNGCYQIHGHRNVKHVATMVNDHAFNLEGSVEFGGSLRCVKLYHGGIHTFDIENDVYDRERLSGKKNVKELNQTGSVGDAIAAMRENKYIKEKQFGDISSFNFTKSAFYDKIWDDQTMKARGLYINIPKEKVVARAYDKFFNIGEREETKIDALQREMKFPATAYVKENGFLGIVSYDEDNDSLFITTKSNPEGDYSKWLRNILVDTVSPENLEYMKQYSHKNNVSFVFECVDMKNDPHIIEYDGNRLFLLDIIYNDLYYHKYSYDDMCAVAETVGLSHKELARKFNSWQEFYDFYYESVSENFRYHGRNIEGFVIEDASGYMVKMKLAYYNFWKFMRSISSEAIKYGHINGKRMSSLLTPLSNHYYSWVRTLHDSADIDSIPKDICNLRKMFYKTEIGRKYADDFLSC